MPANEPPNRPGRALRAVVLLLLCVGIVALLSAAYLRWTQSPPAPVLDPAAPEQPAADPRALVLDFTVATIPEAAADQPAPARLLQSIGSAPGAQADAPTVQSWLSEISTLARSRLATIQSRPRLTVASGQEAALEVGGSGPSSASSLRIAVTPRLAHGDSVLLDLRIDSKSAEGLLEMWAKEAGLALGATASLEREIVVLPGGGAGLAAAIRSPTGREGWLVVIVVPQVMPPQEPTGPTEQP